MIANLVALLFLSREYGHRAHLKTQSYSEHMALGDFYESIIELADKLVEAYQGRYQIIDIPYMKGEEGSDPIEVLSRHLKLVESVRYDSIPKEDTALQNIVDEVVGQYLSTLYKLKNLK